MGSHTGCFKHIAKFLSEHWGFFLIIEISCNHSQHPFSFHESSWTITVIPALNGISPSLWLEGAVCPKPRCLKNDWLLLESREKSPVNCVWTSGEEPLSPPLSFWVGDCLLLLVLRFDSSWKLMPEKWIYCGRETVIYSVTTKVSGYTYWTVFRLTTTRVNKLTIALSQLDWVFVVQR